MTVEVRATPAEDENTIPPDAGESPPPPVEPTPTPTSGELTPAPAEAGAPADPPPDRHRTAWPRRAWFWLALLCVALLAVSVISVLGWHRESGRAGDLQHTAALRTSALQAARKYATDLTTYAYQDLDQQQATLNGESTAKFQKTFATSQKTLGPIFTSLHAKATGKVLDAAVKAVSDTAAVVLIFVDQQADSTQLKSPSTQSSRLRVNLVRQHGRWLLDSVDLV